MLSMAMGGQPRRSRDEPTAVAAREVVARPPSRVIIEDVTPQVDGGRFAAKRAVGEAVAAGRIRIRVIRCREGVLDLSRRSDIASVAERLSGVEAHP